MLEDTLAGGDVPAFLYTIPFFHNPTGAVMSTDRCKRLVGLAQKYGFRIISDEPYNLLNLDGDPLPSLASYDDSGLVISLGSFSKILAPGLRLGEAWACGSSRSIGILTTMILQGGLKATRKQFKRCLRSARSAAAVARTPSPRRLCTPVRSLPTALPLSQAVTNLTCIACHALSSAGAGPADTAH
jgi:DNA-binding transcriptional MocR family regulator